jgi:hypothetical protein
MPAKLVLACFKRGAGIHSSITTQCWGEDLDWIPASAGMTNMAMNHKELEAEIMKLDLDARAHLAEKLILSLDAPSEEENLRLWIAEAE